MRFVMLCMAVLFATNSTVWSADYPSTLKRIAETGVINVGYRVSNPPLSFTDGGRTPIGYSIDICHDVINAVKEKVATADLKVNYVKVSSTDRFSAIEKGKVDLLCGATTKTHARSQRVGFSLLTFVTGASLLSPDNKKVQGIADLAGRRVAVVSGTSTMKSLQEALAAQNIEAEIVSVQSGSDAMSMMDKGEIDAFSSDQVVLIGQVIARQKDSLYFLSDELFSYEPLALAFARGDTEFQYVVDRAISGLSKNRKIEEYYDKWMGRFGQKPPVLLKALYRLNAIP